MRPLFAVSQIPESQYLKNQWTYGTKITIYSWWDYWACFCIMTVVPHLIVFCTGRSVPRVKFDVGWPRTWRIYLKVGQTLQEGLSNRVTKGKPEIFEINWIIHILVYKKINIRKFHISVMFDLWFDLDLLVIGQRQFNFLKGHIWIM